MAKNSLVPAVNFADAKSLNERPWLHGFHGTCPSFCLFRREIFDNVGGYRTLLRFAYDWELYTRFLVFGGGVVFKPQVLGIYRIHDEQSVQTSNIEGLWDMLDLWPKERNDHWPAKELASLVVTQCGSELRSPGGFRGIKDIFCQVQRCGLTLRFLQGVPAALWQKVLVRGGVGRSNNPGHYISPVNHVAAVEQANLYLRGYVEAQRL